MSQGAVEVGSTAGPTTRVIVVGRTALAGVDAALRRDRSIELVRAGTPMAAIGEASSPMDEPSTSDVTVVVSPEVLAGGRAGPFSRAIRRVDERARLLCLGDEPLEGFDAALGARPEAASLLSLVRHAAPASAPASIEVETADEIADPTDATDLLRTQVEAVPSANPATTTSPSLTAPVSPAAALATGRDPVAAALDGLRERWNLSEAKLGEASEPGTPITFNGRVVGQLVTRPALPQEAAARESELLSPWIVLARQQEQLRHAAFSDELTGAYNRRFFNRFLAAAIASATEKRHTVTLLVFDVDNFKSYNDRFGHAAGDEILMESVRLLNTCIRATDRVCRVGGDEFAVIFHDPAGPRGPGGVPTGAGGPTSPQSIADIVRRIQSAICGHKFPKLAELAPGTLTISGGMATFPWDGRTVSQLLDRADALALQSKREGKNKITFGPGAEQVCGV